MVCGYVLTVTEKPCEREEKNNGKIRYGKLGQFYLKFYLVFSSYIKGGKTYGT